MRKWISVEKDMRWGHAFFLLPRRLRLGQGQRRSGGSPFRGFRLGRRRSEESP